MEEAATVVCLLTNTYWPGIYRDVKEYCSSCPACQLAHPKGRPGGPLQPMPLTSTPFESIAIVGPLPKGKGGYKYIMVLIDCATRYPEAAPLRSTSLDFMGQLPPSRD